MAPKAVSLVTFTARMTGRVLVIRVFSASVSINTRICAIECFIFILSQNLPDVDGAGKSDPYVKVSSIVNHDN